LRQQGFTLISFSKIRFPGRKCLSEKEQKRGTVFFDGFHNPKQGYNVRKIAPAG